mmetsp:Transcript_30606/g.90767  ORF Transcript_30606/g.90767 Transcript_30606/m.90767 type:complete len:531 (-) Transcript_30606:605-2197(-)|eukprot:360181-Chlamydomonas_euryale.AAC.2
MPLALQAPPPPPPRPPQHALPTAPGPPLRPSPRDASLTVPLPLLTPPPPLPPVPAAKQKSSVECACASLPEAGRLAGEPSRRPLPPVVAALSAARHRRPHASALAPQKHAGQPRPRLLPSERLPPPACVAADDSARDPDTGAGRPAAPGAAAAAPPKALLPSAASAASEAFRLAQPPQPSEGALAAALPRTSTMSVAGPTASPAGNAPAAPASTQPSHPASTQPPHPASTQPRPHSAAPRLHARSATSAPPLAPGGRAGGFAAPTRPPPVASTASDVGSFAKLLWGSSGDVPMRGRPSTCGGSCPTKRRRRKLGRSSSDSARVRDSSSSSSSSPTPMPPSSSLRGPAATPSCCLPLPPPQPRLPAGYAKPGQTPGCRLPPQQPSPPTLPPCSLAAIPGGRLPMQPPRAMRSAWTSVPRLVRALAAQPWAPAAPSRRCGAAAFLAGCSAGACASRSGNARTHAAWHAHPANDITSCLGSGKPRRTRVAVVDGGGKPGTPAAAAPTPPRWRQAEHAAGGVASTADHSECAAS